MTAEESPSRITDHVSRSTPDVSSLVAGVLKSAKYRNVCDDLIRSIGAQELERRRGLKEAIKATKDRLHQVAGAYLDRRVDYAAWLEELAAASQAGDRTALRPICARIMRHHASSRERLPFLAEFYARTLAGLGPIRSVLDVACGLNPLAIPWMPLAEEAAYYAYDIYHDMVGFVGRFLPLAGMAGQAVVCDVTRHCPSQRVDLALLLKTIPCLEQVDRSAGRRLLDRIDATHLLVSFPTRSLCGASKGMPANYEAHFHDLVAGRGWTIERFEFPTELAFVARPKAS